MRRLIVLSSIAAVLFTGGLTLLHAQGPGGPGRDGTRGDRPRVANAGPRTAAPGFGQGRRGGGIMGFGIAARNLDLTDEQRTQVAAITQAARDESGPLADQLRLAESTLHREIFAESRDEATVAELIGQVSALRQQLADIRLRTTTSVADLLTAEQREQVRVGPPRGRGGRATRG